MPETTAATALDRLESQHRVWGWDSSANEQRSFVAAAFRSNRVVYASATAAAVSTNPAAPGADGSAALNQAGGDLSTAGGGVLVIDKGYNCNLFLRSNVTLLIQPGAFLVNGTASGLNLLENANPTGNSGEEPIDHNIGVICPPNQISLYLGHTLNASGSNDDHNNARTSFPAGWPSLYLPPVWHWQLGLVFLGVRGLYLENCWWYDNATFGLTVSNVHDCTLVNPRQTLVAVPPTGFDDPGNTDFIHFGGNCSNFKIVNPTGSSGDTWIPLNSEFYTGPITKVKVHGGVQEPSQQGVLLFSTRDNSTRAGTRIDDIDFYGTHFNCSGMLLVCEDLQYNTLGDVGRVGFHNCSFTPYGDHNAYAAEYNEMWMRVRGRVERLDVDMELRRYFEASPATRSFFRIDYGQYDRLRLNLKRQDDGVAACDPNDLIRMDPGAYVRELDLGDTEYVRDWLQTPGGNLLKNNGGYAERLVANRLKVERAGNVLNVASGGFGAIHLGGVTQHECLTGSALVTGGAGVTLPELTLGNFSGPLDGSNLPKISTLTVASKKGGAFLAGGSGAGAGSAGAVLAADRFTGAANTLLENHTPDKGGPWVKYGTVPIKITDHQAQPGGNSGSVALAARYAINTGQADVKAYMVLRATQSGPCQAGILFRLSDADNYFACVLYTGGQFNVYKVVAGGLSVLDSKAVTWGGIEYRIDVSAVGDAINASLNGVLFCSPITDAFNNTATRHGQWHLDESGSDGTFVRRFRVAAA